MNASTTFSFPQHWNAQDLAAAVPLRLHELFDFDVVRDGPLTPSANEPQQPRTWRKRDYLRLPALPASFRVY